MSYDLHGAWEDTAGHNSPLFARSSESGDQAKLNVVGDQTSRRFQFI